MDKSKIEAGVRLILQGIGEDPEREGLIDTPARIARMYEEICAGYTDSAAVHLSRTFTAENTEMIIERDIPFYSMCEHHMMPFFGKVTIAYIPDGKVVGISKLARLVEVYGKRLQIQERMTVEIADALMKELAPRGAYVIIEAEHLCMSMRGIKKPGSRTVTVASRGAFDGNSELENKLYQMLSVSQN